MQQLVCHVNLARGFRGGERQTELLVRHLADLGVRQVLVARRGQPLTERVGDVPELTVRAVAGNALGALRGTRGVGLVHAHEMHGAHGAFLRRRLTGTPYLITRRVMNRPRDDLFTRRVYRDAALVAAISGPVADVINRYDPTVRTVVIPSAPSGFEPDHAVVADLRKRYAGRFLVGHVAALDNRTKGQVHVIDAARRLATTHPGVHFLLIGRGRDERWLRDRAADLDNLEFTGFVDNVGDYLASLDLLILPSLTEGLGSVLLDAMQFGVPVIASRVGGVPDLIKDGDNGVMIEPGRVAPLVSAIAALHDDEPRRRVLGEAGRRSVAHRTAMAMAQRYRDVYLSIVGRDDR